MSVIKTSVLLQLMKQNIEKQEQTLREIEAHVNFWGCIGNELSVESKLVMKNFSVDREEKYLAELDAACKEAQRQYNLCASEQTWQAFRKARLVYETVRDSMVKSEVK